MNIEKYLKEENLTEANAKFKIVKQNLQQAAKYVKAAKAAAKSAEVSEKYMDDLADVSNQLYQLAARF